VSLSSGKRKGLIRGRGESFDEFDHPKRYQKKRNDLNLRVRKEMRGHYSVTVRKLPRKKDKRGLGLGGEGGSVLGSRRKKESYPEKGSSLGRRKKKRCKV